MNLKRIYAFLRFGSLPTGLLLFLLGLWPAGVDSRAGGWILSLKIVTLALGLLLAGMGAFIIYNVSFSRNGTRLHPLLKAMETWTVTGDERHNANTDLIWFRGAFYLAYASSPSHFGGTDGEMLVKRSTDAKSWEQVAVFGRGEEDIRDPKFAVIGGRLFLYVLLNRATQPLPYATRVAWTEDGKCWSNLSSIGHEGWLFGRPKTRDGQSWYAPAYWHKFHQNALFATRDGTTFERIATIQEAHFVNEPEIEFMSDGHLLATGRGDYQKETIRQLIGIRESCTFISVAPPPYTGWQTTAEDHLTRLDGPVMFSARGRLYAVGRAHPYFNAVFPKRGAALAKKRTAIFLVCPEGLTHISDLPSSGDTSYAGVTLKDGWVYISYYTSDIRRDPIWLFGMLEPSEIRMVRIDLDAVECAAGQACGEAAPMERDQAN